MLDRHSKIIYLIILVCFGIFSNIQSQNSNSLYRMNLDVGLGFGMHVTNLTFEDVEAQQGIFSFRVMWQPEHHLRVGIESGYLPLYSLDAKVYDTIFGSTDVFLTLQAIPIMFVSITEVAKNFEVIAGIGGSILISEVNSFDNNVRSTSWNNTYEFGVSYLLPVSKTLKMGGEVKTFYFSRLENFHISLQVAIKYDFFSY